MKTGVCSVTFRDFSPEQVIALCCRAGLDGIEWGGDVHVPCGDIETARKVGELTRKAGLSVTGYGSYCRCDEPAEIPVLLETARSLQAPRIRIWAGWRAFSEKDQTPFLTCVSFLQELCIQASDMEIVAEFHSNTLNDSAAAFRRLRTWVNRSNFKSGFQIYQEQNHRTELPEMEEWIGTVHVYAFRNAPLSECADLWTGLLPLLVRPDRPFLLEFVHNGSVEQFMEDAALLKEWGRRF